LDWFLVLPRRSKVFSCRRAGSLGLRPRTEVADFIEEKPAFRDWPASHHVPLAALRRLHEPRAFFRGRKNSRPVGQGDFSRKGFGARKNGHHGGGTVGRGHRQDEMARRPTNFIASYGSPVITPPKTFTSHGANPAHAIKKTVPESGGRKFPKRNMRRRAVGSAAHSGGTKMRLRAWDIRLCAPGKEPYNSKDVWRDGGWAIRAGLFQSRRSQSHGDDSAFRKGTRNGRVGPAGH